MVGEVDRKENVKEKKEKKARAKMKSWWNEEEYMKEAELINIDSYL